jgi:TfoX/Sxy family transcriptional regulator of competence genes
VPGKRNGSQPTETQTTMPVWRKAPPELIAFFKSLVSAYPQVELRAMFGDPCAFVNGYMSTGLFADRMFVKLDPDGANKLLSMPGAEPLELTPGRFMSGYVLVPEDLRSSPKLEVWLGEAFTFASSLPPKVMKDKAKTEG